MKSTRREFITNVSAATLATAFPLARSLAETGFATDIDASLPALATAEEWADRVFAKLLKIWTDGLEPAKDKAGWLWADFWKAGNTLDCAINYFVVRKPADTQKVAPHLINQSLTYLLDQRQYPRRRLA